VRAGGVRDDHAGSEGSGLTEVCHQRRERVVGDGEDHEIGRADDVLGPPVRRARQEGLDPRNGKIGATAGAGDGVTGLREGSAHSRADAAGADDADCQGFSGCARGGRSRNTGRKTHRCTSPSHDPVLFDGVPVDLKYGKPVTTRRRACEHFHSRVAPGTRRRATMRRPRTLYEKRTLVRHWRDAMGEALYGPDGFFRHPDLGPADHFRTSAHTGRLFAGAIMRLIERVDAALEHPTRLDVIDVGAGRGELITALLNVAPAGLRDRIRPVAVEIGPRPDGLDDAVVWLDKLPAHITGIVLATEWLDNVPLDIVDMTGAGWRLVTVDSAGATSLGDPPAPADAAWLDRWWPEGVRAEIGTTRDAAWSDAVGRIGAGLALAVDYGHTRARRPALGTLTGFRHGREVLPVPDGSCDLTAHVAVDAVAAAGSAVANLDAQVVGQAEALRALGVNGRRPGLDLAHADPLAYVRALADASTAAELTDPTGLGDHFWICQPVRLDAATLGLPACAK